MDRPHLDHNCDLLSHASCYASNAHCPGKALGYVIANNSSKRVVDSGWKYQRVEQYQEVLDDDV